MSRLAHQVEIPALEGYLLEQEENFIDCSSADEVLEKLDVIIELEYEIKH